MVSEGVSGRMSGMGCRGLAFLAMRWMIEGKRKPGGGSGLVCTISSLLFSKEYY